MNQSSIIGIIIFALLIGFVILFPLIVWISDKISDAREIRRINEYMKYHEEIIKHQEERENLYFTFNYPEQKVIKAFAIVVDKDVHIRDFVDCCNRYTDPRREYNENHVSLTDREFTLIKEVLL